MVNKLKAVAYVRTATESMEDECKINAQLDAIKRYADVHGIEIVAEYKDLGKSGNNTVGRPGFKRMLEDITLEPTEVKYVLVSNLSRFGRSSAQILSSIGKLVDSGVEVIFVEDGVDSSSYSGKVLLSVLSVLANVECGRW